MSQYDNSNYNQGYSQVNTYQPDVTIGEWIVTFLILSIPFVNIIMMFVWAFGDNEKISKSNYFKAYLIMMGISFDLVIIVLVLFWSNLEAIDSQIS